MPKYQLLIEGRNNLISLDGEMKKRGFFTVRMIEAADENEAKEKAFVSVEDRIVDSLQNNPSDPHRLLTERILVVGDSNPIPSVQAGLLWYLEGDEEKRAHCRTLMEKNLKS